MSTTLSSITLSSSLICSLPIFSSLSWYTLRAISISILFSFSRVSCSGSPILRPFFGRKSFCAYFPSPSKSHSSGYWLLEVYISSIISMVSLIISKIWSLRFSPSSTCLLWAYMTSLCLFITSSYCSTCFLISKLRASTFFCAFSIDLLRMECSIGCVSSNPSLSIMPMIFSEPKSLISSSSIDI